MKLKLKTADGRLLYGGLPNTFLCYTATLLHVSI